MARVAEREHTPRHVIPLLLPVSFSPRRHKELMSDPGLVIVPPGPGWRTVWFSVLLVTVVAGWFVYAGGMLIDAADRSSSGFQKAGRAEQYAVSRVMAAAADRRVDPGSELAAHLIRQLPRDTDGVMEPLWPWIMAKFLPHEELTTGWSGRDFLRRGKSVQVWMAALFVWVAGVLAARSMSPGAVMAMLVPGAFVGLLPQAVSFQPDVLYYALTFLSWVCAVRLLMKNSVGLHAVFGMLSGLAWLADSSAWILTAAWFLASGARWVRGILRRGERPDEVWSCRNHFIGLVVAGLCWFAVSGPRCSVASERWGSAFFSWPQQWMWADNADAAAKLAPRYPVAGDYAGLPADGGLSLSTWRRTHTAEQAGKRLADGWSAVWKELVAPKPVGISSLAAPHPQLMAWRGVWAGAAALTLLVAGGMVMARRHAVDRDGLKLPCGSIPAALFVLLAATGYGLWYGWYLPIERSERFLPVIYFPVTFSFVWGAVRLATLARMRGASRWQLQALHLLFWLIFAAVAVEAIHLTISLHEGPV